MPTASPKTYGSGALLQRARRLPTKLWTRLTAQLFGVITHVETSQPLVALTFDDGPHPQWTPQLLKLLERHNAKATFFVVGEMAQRQPELIEQIAAAGHSIGNHSWNHPSFPCIDNNERRRQVERCEQTIAAHSVKLFRPPYGDLDWSARLLLARLGYTVICWNSGASDWEQQDADWLFDQLNRQMRPGSIVLLHDHLFTFSATDLVPRTELLGALERLLSEHAAKLRFVTVPELFEHGSARKKIWLKRSEPDWLMTVGSVSNLGYNYKTMP